ncbi:MAG: peptide deformylase [candidate division NC10 bacterium RIFCSPLOWO2_12_FULL_66_18]|nr:MAG: peptide deformylase [candidate division NC10 bacterium RIFCSPLOWO2_02_FULL_66_22]OGB95735.1 MAG: peptide deformylase [candidate division NC10 bacterium RIFCSPLOWO2_12_FULL_66_18]
MLTGPHKTRPILTYAHPILRQRARAVSNITGELQRLIDDMVETMYEAPGVGLAANQVGSLRRVFVANPSEDHDPSKLLVLINPELVEAEGESVAEEGCLSIPDFREEVRRARRVLLRGLDRNERPVEIEGEDLLARILQHELDHLNGILFVDRLSPARRDILLRKLKKAFRIKRA